MQRILDILDQIAGTAGKNAKVAILKEELPNNPLLQKVAKYALDQGKAYNVTELNLEHPKAERGVLKDMFDFLDYMALKRGASQDDINLLSSLCLDDATEEIVHKIINHDLKIGAKTDTFNKALPGLIYEVPYNRYASFAKLNPEKLEGEELIIQLKNDGRFSYMHDPKNSLKPFCSRQGISYHLHGYLEDAYAWVNRLQEKLGQPIILEGELLVLDEAGKYLPRKIGNGMIEKFILSNGSNELLGSRLRYVVWGYITEQEWRDRKSKVTYSTVWDNMKACAPAVNQSAILLTPSKKVKNYTEAMEFYRKIRALKLEGAMLKLANKLCWKDNSSGNMNGFKMKAEAEAEFEIIDAYPGDKGHKWENYLGGLLVATSDRKIITNIGGGFTDGERLLGVDWWLGKKGKIITGKFTDIVTDKTSRETYCLEHSRMPNMGGELVETRFSEKTEADTFEYCCEQLLMA